MVSLLIAVRILYYRMTVEHHWLWQLVLRSLLAWLWNFTALCILLCIYLRTFWHMSKHGTTYSNFHKFTCQIDPSQNLLSSKMSWRITHNLSWRRLKDVVSVTIFRLPTRLENKLVQEFVKICLEVFFQTPWRPTKCFLGRNLYLSPTNLNLYLANLYLINLYLANQRQIQDKSKINYNPIISIFIAFWNSNNISTLRFKINFSINERKIHYAYKHWQSNENKKE